MDIEPDKWLYDKISPDFIQLHSVKEVLYTGRTKYQDARIIRSGAFGMCLVLDGKIQSSEKDEFIYHEALVQPSMLAHPCPETVFIAGGGEGATLREVLSYKTVKRAVMVDIDEDVVTLSRKYLPEHSRGSFEDERTELLHMDAREYLSKTSEKYDVIVIDIPDPIEEGPAYLLFTKEFYQLAMSRLTDNGIICAQAGSAAITELLNFTTVHNTLKSVFPVVNPYQAEMPCFGGSWGFCLAALNLDVASFSRNEVEGRIKERELTHLRFYDGITHQGMFALPKYLREAFPRQDRLITDDKPLFMYQG